MQNVKRHSAGEFTRLHSLGEFATDTKGRFQVDLLLTLRSIKNCLL